MLASSLPSPSPPLRSPNPLKYIARRFTYLSDLASDVWHLLHRTLSMTKPNTAQNFGDYVVGAPVKMWGVSAVPLDLGDLRLYYTTNSRDLRVHTVELWKEGGNTGHEYLLMHTRLPPAQTTFGHIRLERGEVSRLSSVIPSAFFPSGTTSPPSPSSPTDRRTALDVARLINFARWKNSKHITGKMVWSKDVNPPLPFSHLIAAWYVASSYRPAYNIADAPCFWFAGVVGCLLVTELPSDIGKAGKGCMSCCSGVSTTTRDILMEEAESLRNAYEQEIRNVDEAVEKYEAERDAPRKKLEAENEALKAENKALEAEREMLEAKLREKLEGKLREKLQEVQAQFEALEQANAKGERL